MLLMAVPFLLSIGLENVLLGLALQVAVGGGMVIVDVLAITALPWRPCSPAALQPWRCSLARWTPSRPSPARS